jgi:hypothetical protein
MTTVALGVALFVIFSTASPVFGAGGSGVLDSQNEAARQADDASVADSDGPADVGELIDKRAADSQTFQLSDGSKCLEIYGGPIHFKDTQGNWQLFDTDLVTADAPDTFRTAATPVDLRIGSDAGGATPVRLRGEDSELGIDLLDAAETKPIVLGGQATYFVDEQVSVTYAVRRSGVEQTVILTSAKAPARPLLA